MNLSRVGEQKLKIEPSSDNFHVIRHKDGIRVFRFVPPRIGYSLKALSLPITHEKGKNPLYEPYFISGVLFDLGALLFYMPLFLR